MSLFFQLIFNFFALSSSSGTPEMQMLVHLKLSRTLLTLSSRLDSFFYLFWLGVFCFLIFQIANFIVTSSTLPLIACKLFFISVSVSLISDWSFFMLRFPLNSLRILRTSVLNSASSRLHVPFCLVLFLEFCFIVSFRTFFFVLLWQPPCFRFCVLGRVAPSLRIGTVA